MKMQTSAHRLPLLAVFRENRNNERKSERDRDTALRVSRLRRWALYRPLALVMSVLLIPSLSWLESMAGIPLGSSAKSFQASAQTTFPCTPSPQNAIIQTYCSTEPFNFGDLNTLESDAVNAYLAMHKLPAGDAQVIYNYGRSDLRSAIRADMLTTMFGIIGKPAAQRTAHEQFLYTWLQTLVQRNEINEYTAALNAYQSWQNDPCTFTLDPDIAQQYGLSYNGSAFCFLSFTQGVAQPPIPAESYFEAYGLKQSYGAPATTFPYFPTLANNTGLSVGETVGISLASGAVIGAYVGLALFASFNAATAAVSSGTLSIGLAVTSDAFALSVPTIEALGGAVAAVAGPVGIVAGALAIGVAAGLEVYNEGVTKQQIAAFLNQLNQVQATPPDLSTFNDAVGLYKLETTLVSQTLPEVASTATLPAHRPGTDPGFNISTSASSTPSVATTLTYTDWNGATWSAETWGGWFVQTCTSAASACPQPDSITASIQYVDWSGVNWTASRLGNTFTSTKASPASTDVNCPANATTGVSAGSDFSACKSYASTTIPVTDAQGNHIVVGISALSPPGFTSPTTLVFSPGTPSTVTITAGGNPTPTICLSSGTLTSDFTLNGGNSCGTGSFTLAFNGDLNAAQQVYPLTLTAANSTGSAPQTFSVNVAIQINIISPNTLNATAGIPVNFTVVATGVPTPKLTSSEFPFAGLSFQDNGNGTATISGVVPYPQESICQGTPCNTGVTATNSQGSVTQYIQVNAGSPPQANLLPPTSATFYAGVPNQLLLNSNGAITPVSWGYVQNPNTPTPWLSLKDNGDGTAWLTGTPPVGTTGTFYPSIGPGAAYSLEVINPFSVTVENVPIITSPNVTYFVASTPASFSAAATQGTVTLGTGTPLPSGLSFTSGSITGTPAVGTGGQYQVTLNDNAGAAGSTSQSLTLNVWEAPQITSSSTATFFVGMPGSFAVTTTGFPNLSTGPVPLIELPPTSPTQGEGMAFGVTGVPADLQFSNLNPRGQLTGTLTIQGTPSAADVGLHPVTITAQNGVGAPAQQTLLLDIVQITAPAPASGRECNGTFNGTFNGDITVAAGQNCMFVAGSINGNVRVHGGSLALTNVKVTGNVSVHGASAFSFGEGSEVTGRLDIHEVASGSTTNQICGAKLDGNVLVLRNATPIQIGSASDSSCLSNSFGDDLEINGNTGVTTIYNNSVAKRLTCENNTSITGAGNSAEKMHGQCSSF